MKKIKVDVFEFALGELVFAMFLLCVLLANFIFNVAINYEFTFVFGFLVIIFGCVSFVFSLGLLWDATHL